LLKKARFFLIALAVLTFILVPLLNGCSLSKTDRLQVVTTTSLLSYIVRQVGGDKVDVINIIPPTQHPGDFDATPGSIKKLSDASLFLWHNWPGETFVPALLATANHTGMKAAAIDIKGSWMTPQVQRDAADKIAEALSQTDGKNRESYRQGADAYKQRVTVKENEVRARLTSANVSGTKALVSFWQADFIKWDGLNTIAVYGPAELTIDATKNLVDQGKKTGVTLVVDNLQNARDAGKAIAGELGATRVILSYFPGGFDDTETWEKAIDKNVDLILSGLSK
jgi:zinc transport system substrate-binding protein